MFVVSTSRRFGSMSHFSLTLAVGRRLSVAIIDRAGLTYAGRYAPPLDRDRQRSLLYIMSRGRLRLNGDRWDGPSAIVVDEARFENVRKEELFDWVNIGEPLQAIELRLPWSTAPPPTSSLWSELPLSSSTWAAAAAVHADPNTLQALVAALADDGVVATADAADAADAVVDADVDDMDDVDDVEHDGDHARLWAGARLLASRFDLSGSLDQLADGCGVSVRQVSRSLQRFTSSLTVPFSQWRDSTRRIRVKMAVMGLSAAEVSVADVAAAVGYGSADAMARAFRDVGIPAPSQVRDEILEDACALAG